MDTVPVYYGDIKVTLLNDSHYPDWVVTEFMIQRVRTLLIAKAEKKIYAKTFSLIIFRVKLNALYAISISQHGPTLGFQIPLKLSYDLCVHLEKESVQKRDRLLCIAALVWAEAELSFV